MSHKELGNFKLFPSIWLYTNDYLTQIKKPMNEKGSKPFEWSQIKKTIQTCKGGCCMLQWKAEWRYDAQGHSSYMNVTPSQFCKGKG